MTHHDEIRKDPYKRVTDDVLAPMGPYWSPWLKFGIALSALMFLGLVIGEYFQIAVGMGETGLMHPMMWAVYITNFVFWVGVAHSGTLISAILFLFRAPFRAAFSRSAEAMTVIAVTTAAMFPVLHLGRAWRAYYLFPYPNERYLWINFKSPLILDVFAVSTYLTVSVLFFWFGLVPDVAIIRDRSTGWKRTIYGILSIGWEGSHKQWKHYQMAYSILASLATPLVLSVHTVVSWDFALGIVPGWHSTIFPPYFVAGAIFSGLAMVVTLLIPMRKWLHLEDYITVDRLDQVAKLILLTSLIVSFSYLMEYWTTWYGREPSDVINLMNKVRGTFATEFWIMTACNMVIPLLLFVRWFRRNPLSLWIICIFVNIGMWLERFVIIAGSLARDYEPYSWAAGGYHLRPVEYAITLGSFGWFIMLFLLFTKYLPTLPISEVKRDILLEHREEAALEAVHDESGVEKVREEGQGGMAEA